MLFKMKKTFTILLILITCSLDLASQNMKVGIMPARIKFTNGLGGGGGIFSFPSPANIGGESIPQYEEKFLELVNKTFIEELRKKSFNVIELDLESLSKEERGQEKKLYDLIRTEQWGAYSMETSGFVWHSKKKKKEINGTKQSSQKTAPLANIFADKMDTDVLLYTIIVGHHRRSKAEIKKNKPFPEVPNGNMTIYGFLVDANDGTIFSFEQIYLKASAAYSKDYPIKDKKVINRTELYAINTIKNLLKFRETLN